MASDVIYYANKIYLLGTADFGPVNTPIKISSTSHAKSVFGEKGTLLDTFRIIRESNMNCDIYMVKITGTHSELFLNINVPSGEIEQSSICFKSKYANEIYNNIEIIIGENSIYINYPTEELGNYYLEYKYYKTDENNDVILNSDGNRIFKTVYDIVDEINEDTRLLNSYVYCYASCEPNVMANAAFLCVNEATNKLSGGNSGIYYNKNMMYNCLSETYNILEGREIDLIIPIECFYDDVFTDNQEDLSLYYDLEREYLTLKDSNGDYLNYYIQLLEFCRKQLRFGFITHGIMGMNLTNDVFIDQTNYYLRLKYFKDKNNENKNYEKYKHLVSVCCTDIYTTYGTRVYNSYILYTALVADLQISKNTTNKPLPNSFTMFNDFDTRMLAKIRDLGYTAFRYSVLKKTVVCANGITTSSDNKFKFLCNVRMCQLVMTKVSKMLSEYIGENVTTLIKTKEINKRLINILTTMVTTKILKGFVINSITNPNIGHLMIDISFRTLYMNEDIRAYSGLTIYSGGKMNE